MKPEEIVTTAMLEADTLLSFLDADRLATAALRALEKAGYRVVPVEPTFAMCRAAKWALERAKERDGKLQHDRPYTAEEKHAIRWRAMLDAAGRDEGAERQEAGVGLVG